MLAIPQVMETGKALNRFAARSNYQKGTNLNRLGKTSSSKHDFLFRRFGFKYHH